MHANIRVSCKIILSKCFALFLQAMYANTSVAVGMKGASKEMAAMNKVSLQFLVNPFLIQTYLWVILESAEIL